MRTALKSVLRVYEGAEPRLKPGEQLCSRAELANLQRWFRMSDDELLLVARHPDIALLAALPEADQVALVEVLLAHDGDIDAWAQQFPRPADAERWRTQPYHIALEPPVEQRLVDLMVQLSLKLFSALSAFSVSEVSSHANTHTHELAGVLISRGRSSAPELVLRKLGRVFHDGHPPPITMTPADDKIGGGNGQRLGGGKRGIHGLSCYQVYSHLTRSNLVGDHVPLLAESHNVSLATILQAGQKHPQLFRCFGAVHAPSLRGPCPKDGLADRFSARRALHSASRAPLHEHPVLLLRFARGQVSFMECAAHFLCANTGVTTDDQYMRCHEQLTPICAPVLLSNGETRNMMALAPLLSLAVCNKLCIMTRTLELPPSRVSRLWQALVASQHLGDEEPAAVDMTITASFTQAALPPASSSLAASPCSPVYTSPFPPRHLHLAIYPLSLMSSSHCSPPRKTSQT